jgi:PAS domain S-box-containing protein
MIDEQLQEDAALYASGAMTTAEREQFELILRFHQELREFVGQLQETAAAVASSQAGGADPSRDLKDRVLARIAGTAQQTRDEAFVVTSPQGLVEWVNPAFTEMCGYTLEELRGRKLGPILQGASTDRATAERMRAAVHAFRPCHERILNYHKDTTPYWVEIEIKPLTDGAGKPRWMVATEREITDSAAA